MTSLLRDERRYVKRWAHGSWGSARCKFCRGGGIACIFWHASPPFYLCDMRTSAFLGTWYIHGHRWLRALGPGAGREGGAQLNQFPSWLLANCSHTHTHRNTHALFFSLSDMGLIEPIGWSGRKRGSVMLLLMSLIKCYLLRSESVSLIGQRSKKKKVWKICLNTS